MQKPLHWVQAQIKGIRLLYEDSAVLAVYKPSGVLVHQTQGLKEPTLAGWVKKQTAQVASYPLYRLDRGTSGIVLFAKRKAFAQQLNEAPMQKIYMLAVRGRTPLSGVIEHPLLNRSETQKVPAQTRYRRVSDFQIGTQVFSWVLAWPKTGRVHQIRRHFKHISHPLVGDVKYGKGPINRLFRGETGLNRLMLHARTLNFRHPETQKQIMLRANWDAEEQQALTRLAQ
tara:strand:- start:1912 stop:2595 length:684 start_codon:yes stop_codon:yes gene_type:complete